MSNKKILVLGCGKGARPCMHHLLHDTENVVTVACRTLSSAEFLVSELGYERASAICLDVCQRKQRDKQIAAHDVVVCLVPDVHRVAVIKSAIRGRTHVVTTGALSPEIRELTHAARKAGITVLTELGLRPGIDHLYAIKAVDEVHARGGKVKTLHSYLGHLPAADHPNTPFQFKVAGWPRDALLARYNHASYLVDGHKVRNSVEALMSRASPCQVTRRHGLVWYPSDDALGLRGLYNIPEAHTVVRGSLWNRTSADVFWALLRIGWLDADRTDWLREGMTWAEITQRTVWADDASEDTLIARIRAICEFPSHMDEHYTIAALRWLGLFSSEPADMRGGSTLFDIICTRLEELLEPKYGDQDVLLLHQELRFEREEGDSLRRELLVSTLELYGDIGPDSAPSIAVGITCGVATQLLLDGEHEALTKPGVIAPHSKDVCDPIREGLEAAGIKALQATW